MNWYSATHPLHLCRFQPAAYATFTWVARDWPVGIQVWQTGRRKSTAWACTYAGHYGHGRTPLEATNRAMRRHHLSAARVRKRDKLARLVQRLGDKS